MILLLNESPEASAAWTGRFSRAERWAASPTTSDSSSARRERAQRSGTAVSAAMRVSVVIPAYNEARRLPATLTGWREFLSSQAFEWELIVVDDGSSDATASVAAGP